MQKPQPEDYGLNEKLCKVIWAQDEARTKKVIKYSFIISLVAFIIIVGDEISTFADLILYSPVLVIFMIIIGKIISKFFLKQDVLFTNYLQYSADLRKYYDWEKRQQQEFWFGLSGSQFEKQIALLFRKKGYIAEVIGGANDEGIDIRLKKDGIVTAVQCKAHRNPVGPRVVRELYGSFKANPQYNNAILIAFSGVTSGARDFAYKNNIKVFTLKDIMEWSKEVKKSYNGLLFGFVRLPR